MVGEARARAVAIEICNRVRVRLVAEVMVQETPLGH